MVKQLLSRDIKNYLRTGPKKILLDVRTQQEWDLVGKPDGDKIELKTYFLEIRRLRVELHSRPGFSPCAVYRFLRTLRF